MKNFCTFSLFLIFVAATYQGFSQQVLTAANSTVTYSDNTSHRAEARSQYAKGILDLTLFSESVALKWAAASEGKMTHYRLLRTVEPDLGWEEVAEVDAPEMDGNFAAKDDNPLPGRVYYKLQAKNRQGEWSTIDVQLINRNLGAEVEDIDFFANNRGELIISRNQMPADLSLIEVYDLQGERVDAEITPFGNFLKIDVSSLSFGVYRLQVPVEEIQMLVSKYFLACGLN